MWEALGWGAVAGSSLIIGAVLGVVHPWRPTWIGIVLGFGAGALISSISFELASEGFEKGGALPLAVGLAIGALSFYVADRGVERLGARSSTGSAGLPLALGALLDGIPEDDVRAVVLATHVLSSASSWSHLRDYCGLDGIEGGKVAARAIELIVEATRARAKQAA